MAADAARVPSLSIIGVGDFTQASEVWVLRLHEAHQQSSRLLLQAWDLRGPEARREQRRDEVWGRDKHRGGWGWLEQEE